MKEGFSKNALVRKGKQLAFLLRHDKEAFKNGKINEQGWRRVDELLLLGFTKPLLEEIVETNNKKRYEFSTDHTLIRARQGHSIPVDVEFERKNPPRYLYHGTTIAARESIITEGIKNMNRLYVHLSDNVEAALEVGRRHGGTVVVFQIDTENMAAEGHEFFLSRNNVWLTKHVEPKYICEMHR